ncbi:MAG TPA: cyclic nucleotide-binding domain-containing protein [Abditibacterium sp.]|jgi:CRP-like cAMP-binding protein
MAADALFAVPVSPDACRSAFEAIPHLSKLSDDDCAALAPLLHQREFAAGSTLFYEDDDAGAAYFLVSGAIEIFKSNSDGKKLPLVVLRGSGVLGEIGLLLSDHRTATARTLGAAQVLELSREAFEAALAKGDLAAYRLSVAIARILAQRLALTNEKMFAAFQSDVSDTVQKQLSELQAHLASRWTE